MPSARRALSAARRTSCPITARLPAAARASPPRAEMSVVFPAPLGPRSPKNSPASTASETPAKARTAPKRFSTPRTSTAKAIGQALLRGLVRLNQVGNAVERGEREQVGGQVRKA